MDSLRPSFASRWNLILPARVLPAGSSVRSLKRFALVAKHRFKHCRKCGNPVRIGDGSATVSGYKPPMHRSGDAKSHWTKVREGGGEVGSPKSGYRVGSARQFRPCGTLRRQAKDEASPAGPVCPIGIPECLDAFILGFAGRKAFLLSVVVPASPSAPTIQGTRANFFALVS